MLRLVSVREPLPIVFFSVPDGGSGFKVIFYLLTQNYLFLTFYWLLDKTNLFFICYKDSEEIIWKRLKVQYNWLLESKCFSTVHHQDETSKEFDHRYHLVFVVSESNRIFIRTEDIFLQSKTVNRESLKWHGLYWPTFTSTVTKSRTVSWLIKY